MIKRILIVFMLLLVLCHATPVEAKTYIKATVKADTTKKTTDPVKLTVNVTYNKKKISYVKYMKGSKTTSQVKKSGKKLSYNTSSKKASVKVTENTTYTFVIKDVKGHTLKKTFAVKNYSNPKYLNQYKAIWYPYYTYKDEYLDRYKSNNTEANFRSYFKGVVKKCKDNNMNTIIVHARSFGDAFYQSDYFPVSEFIAGSQGKKLSYDPMKVMVEEAHKEGMFIEAWINPYRVAFHTDYSKLHKSHPARVWHDSGDKTKKRNVLSYNGRLYFNPASAEVRDLIVKGAVEIVEKYDVDGIHMDDYFYPSFSSSDYKTAFDAAEYKTSPEKAAGKSIVTFRRNQVNALVEALHEAVHQADPSVSFGISPAGNIENLTSSYAYYVDIEKWTKSTKYVDYITPQIYWGFNHSTAAFDKVLKQWIKITDQKKVNLYIGIASYRVSAGIGSNSKEKSEWNTKTVLRKMIQYARSKNVDGFAVFEYSDLKRSNAKKAVEQMKLELQ